MVDAEVVGAVVVQVDRVGARRDRAADVRAVGVAGSGDRRRRRSRRRSSATPRPALRRQGRERLRCRRARRGHRLPSTRSHSAAASRSTPASSSSGAANPNESRSELETAPNARPVDGGDALCARSAPRARRARLAAAPRRSRPPSGRDQVASGRCLASAASSASRRTPQPFAQPRQVRLERSRARGTRRRSPARAAPA